MSDETEKWSRKRHPAEGLEFDKQLNDLCAAAEEAIAIIEAEGHKPSAYIARSTLAPDGGALDYSIDLQRIIESICHGREIVKPKTGALHHYNMAVEYVSALTAKQAPAKAVEDTKQIKFEDMSEEAQLTVRGMIELCVNQGYGMGMHQGTNYDGEYLPFVKEILAFANDEAPIATNAALDDAVYAFDKLLSFCNCDYLRSGMETEVDIVKDALKNPKVPRGYVLVPKAPSEAMIDAALEYCDGYNSKYFMGLYKAMIEAALRNTETNE